MYITLYSVHPQSDRSSVQLERLPGGSLPAAAAAELAGGLVELLGRRRRARHGRRTRVVVVVARRRVDLRAAAVLVVEVLVGAIAVASASAVSIGLAVPEEGEHAAGRERHDAGDGEPRYRQHRERPEHDVQDVERELRDGVEQRAVAVDARVRVGRRRRREARGVRDARRRERVARRHFAAPDGHRLAQVRRRAARVGHRIHAALPVGRRLVVAR